MSIGTFRYSRANAAVRARVARLLTHPQLHVLASLPTIAGAVRGLAGTPYEEQLRRLPPGPPGLRDVERALDENLVNAFEEVAGLVDGAPRSLVLQMGRIVDADNLKTIFRALAIGKNPEHIRKLLRLAGRHTDIPYDALLKANDVPSAVGVLGRTTYGPALRGASEAYESTGDAFRLEVAIDVTYYHQLWQRVQTLSGEDQARVRRILGTLFDTVNIGLLLRYRLLYNLTPEEIFNYTLPFGWKLSDEEVRKASTASSFAAIVEVLPEPYRGLLAALPDADLSMAGVALFRNLKHAAVSGLLGNPFQTGEIVAYIVLKELEVRDLKTIVEGKHYGVPVEDTEKLLVSTGSSTQE